MDHRHTGTRRTLLAGGLQLAALLVLALALLGGSWLDRRLQPRVLVLVDRSQSVPRDASDRALADVLKATQATGAAVQVIAFAGRPAAAVTVSGPSRPDPDGPAAAAALGPAATHIEAALNVALASHAQAGLSGVVVISDGQETAGQAERALRALHEAGLPLQWLAVGRPPPPVRLGAVLVPDRVTVGQRIPITVQLAGAPDPRPLRLQASVHSASGDALALSGEARVATPTTLLSEARHPGALRVDLALVDPASGEVLDSLPDAAVVDVAPRSAILYAQGATGALAHSLLAGGWPLTVVPAARLDAQAEGLDAYRAVVLEDVAIADASPRFWQALEAAVRQRGLGLLVLGGERSFARGGYRESALESVLPVLSEPAALDPAASIVFAVDKSGSMGQGSGGVDRFQLAQRAVLETARGLGERDALGLLVFDVAPRLLLPLGPAPAGVAALARGWPASPGGGTRLAPALDAAIGELERAGTGRRLLIVVTDGFVDEAPLAGLRARLAGAHIETLALAVGPDADLRALQNLFGSDDATVLQVDQAAELPKLMRSGLERRRARLERGRFATEQPQPLPFAPGTLAPWPPVAAYATTRPRPQAVVALRSARGDPLLAFQTSGQGRVMAITSGLGPGTPAWLQSPQWPRLAGGLADWLGGTPPGGALGLRVSDLAEGLQVDLDVLGQGPAGAGWGRVDPGSVRLTVNTPKAAEQAVATEAVAPGRLRATLPDAGPGLYTFVLSTPLGTQRQLHLRRQPAEGATWGVSPALARWQAAGLIGPWQPGALVPRHDGPVGQRPVDRWLVGLALLLSLSGILVDRSALDGSRLRARLQATWRAVLRRGPRRA